MKTIKKLLIPPVLLFISLASILIFYFFLPGLNIIPFPFNLAGLIISFAGFTIMGKSRELFKKHNTTFDFKKSDYLIEEGVFSKSRNPMYAGMFLLLLGLSICFGNIISLIIPFVFIILIRIIFIPLEEKMMRDTFGQKYLDYKLRTGMWI